jgi:hypothetical protein
MVGIVSVGVGVGVQPPPTPAWANFTLMMKYTPEKWSLSLCVLCGYWLEL